MVTLPMKLGREDLPPGVDIAKKLADEKKPT